MASVSLKKQAFPSSKAVKYGVHCKLYFVVITQKKKYPDVYSLSPGAVRLQPNAIQREAGETAQVLSQQAELFTG